MDWFRRFPGLTFVFTDVFTDLPTVCVWISLQICYHLPLALVPSRYEVGQITVTHSYSTCLHE